MVWVEKNTLFVVENYAWNKDHCIGSKVSKKENAIMRQLAIICTWNCIGCIVNPTSVNIDVCKVKLDSGNEPVAPLMHFPWLPVQSRKIV